MSLSFGNEFIDYCAENYSALVDVANKVDVSYIEYLTEYSRIFSKFYTHLQSHQGQSIEVATLLELGIDFQKICLLVFLFNVKQGNKISMSEDFSSISYSA